MNEHLNGCETTFSCAKLVNLQACQLLDSSSFSYFSIQDWGQHQRIIWDHRNLYTALSRYFSCEVALSAEKKPALEEKNGYEGPQKENSTSLPELRMAEV